MANIGGEMENEGKGGEPDVCNEETSESLVYVFLKKFFFFFFFFGDPRYQIAL
jgi:hypothetical protein